MRKTGALLGSALFLLLAPGVFAGLVPWWISRWQMLGPFLGWAPWRWLGVLLILAGLPVLLASFARFSLRGLGTPAPPFPPRRLVVGGFYRHVRNPMYIAVVAIVLGQALLLGNRHVLLYSLIVYLVCDAFVLACEEPTLRRIFGAEYAEYCAHVRRWMPRLRPWRPPPATGPGAPR